MLKLGNERISSKEYRLLRRVDSQVIKITGIYYILYDFVSIYSSFASVKLIKVGGPIISFKSIGMIT